MLRSAFGCLVALAALGLLATALRAEQPGELVRTQAGELPIVLSAPHGGALPIPSVDERKGDGLPRGGRGFVTARDTGTEELALEVARQIEARFGKKPYYVIARGHRKYLDPNRPPEIAFEDPDARPVYDAYHGALDRFCRRVQATFRTGLLLDIHGQGSSASTVFRGTQNGQTVTLLRQRHGEAAHAGERSLFGQLQARGWTVHPNPLSGREQAGFTGGHIVRTYNAEYGIDAIQLEFGRDYRTEAAQLKTAATLADAVAAYAESYLGMAPPGR
jgi:N-formylglutamate amidohydrolase